MTIIYAIIPGYDVEGMCMTSAFALSGSFFETFLQFQSGELHSTFYNAGVEICYGNAILCRDFRFNTSDYVWRLLYITMLEK